MVEGWVEWLLKWCRWSWSVKGKILCVGSMDCEFSRLQVRVQHVSRSLTCPLLCPLFSRNGAAVWPRETFFVDRDHRMSVLVVDTVVSGGP